MAAQLAGESPRGVARAASFALRCALAALVMLLVVRLPNEMLFDGELLAPFRLVTKLTLAASCAFALGWLRWGRRATQLLQRVPSWAIASALFAVSAWMVHDTTLGAFAGLPQVQDEIAYDLLSRHLANGTPVPASHPLSEFFRLRFVIDDGRVYPLFQPGWPAFLALTRKLHLLTWAPAIATALLVVATFRLGERVHGRMTGVLAALLLLASPFVHFLGGSYYSHAFAAALFVVALERAFAVLRADRDLAPRRATVAAVGGGAASALLFVTRIQTAAALALPLVLLAAILLRRRAHAHRSLAWFVGVAMLGPLGQLGWNVATTHHALELPQDRWFALTESNPDCHRLGFGPDIGCRREHPLDAPDGEGGFTVARAASVTNYRWEVLRRDAWGTALPFALVALVLLRRPMKRDGVLLAAMLAPVGVYFGFYYHAIDHGARLYLDVMPTVSVLVASAIAVPIRYGDEHPLPRLSAVLGAMALFLLVPLGISALAVDLPGRVAENGKDPQAPRVTRNLDAANVHHAVVYMVNCDDSADRADVVYGWSSVLNGLHPETSDRIFVRDFGLAHDLQLAALTPDRDQVRVDCSGIFLERFGAPAPLLAFTSELEAKFPPDAVKDAWARIETDEAASDRAVLTMTTMSPEARLDFRQYVFVGARYRFSARVHRRLDGGKIQLMIDDVAVDPPIETQGPEDWIDWSSTTTLRLEQGVHRLAYRSAGTQGKHTLDWVRFAAE